MRPYNFGLLLLFLSLAFLSCAKRGAPEGGPIDMDPPEFVRASPENFTTNFDAEEIRIYFNEFIKMNDPQRQIIISPPMDPRPEITPLGTASKSVRIRITDTLQPNTTYTINFGRSITDNNEGNPLDFFTYVFSTGSYIDSLLVAGRVSDALLKEPDPFISVMLYEVDSTYSDSVIYKEVPRYVTSTLDSTTNFELRNLKEGTYQLVGMKDVNNNYLFDPSTDKIAFANEFIRIPTDSIPDLELFREQPEFRMLKPSQVASQHIQFGYEGAVQPDSLQINLTGVVPEGYSSKITKDREKDTLHYWYKPNLERDSLHFITQMAGYTDTLITRLKEMDRDSLDFQYEPNATIGFAQNIRILPNMPILSTNDSLISLVDKDTLPVPFSTQYDSWNNAITLSFEKSERQTYRLTALPGAFLGFFGETNDTISEQFRTQAYSDFGNVAIDLLHVSEFPIILQLTTEKGEVQAEKYSTGNTSIRFENIKPGKYFLRLIYDVNENRRWDTGSFLDRRQPEKVVYYPEILDVRANWDLSQPFSVE